MEPETVGSIIDSDPEGMREDWKRLNGQRTEVELALENLQNMMDDFWANWLAPLDHEDRAGNSR